ncbi:MAG TPA: hypothetical protein VJ385_02145, partial [Fibrobacteria bacterium]|nr:hypothetical protein [Fibrobacteria bacterium]
MKALFAFVSALLLPQALRAQNPFDELAPPGRITIFSLGPTAGQLFLGILCGVVLAFCLQWLLTNLSLAVGMSALRGGPGFRGRGPGSRDLEGGAFKIPSGLGIRAMLSSAIALFFACWLAVELVRLQSGVQASVVGLVIWSGFMGCMLYLERAAASSFLGRITGAVRDGIGTLFAPSAAAAGPDLESGALDVERMGRDMDVLLGDPELVASARRGELRDLDRSRFAEIVAGRTDLDGRQADRLTDTLHAAWGRFILENAAPRADVPVSGAPFATAPETDPS